MRIVLNGQPESCNPSEELQNLATVFQSISPTTVAGRGVLAATPNRGTLQSVDLPASDIDHLGEELNLTASPTNQLAEPIHLFAEPVHLFGELVHHFGGKLKHFGEELIKLGEFYHYFGETVELFGGQFHPKSTWFPASPAPSNFSVAA